MSELPRPARMKDDAEQLSGPIRMMIRPRPRDLGDFAVRRVLPYGGRGMVGPYIFFDHMGPAEFPAGTGIDVRPHPHIGIATVTYLFDGEILHRDSLGFVQPIRPGAVNLMVAGRGIVHSERSGDEDRARASGIHGIQLWLALPADLEETEPAFHHYAAGDIPAVDKGGARVRVIIGDAFGATSPVMVLSPTLYAELLFGDGGGGLALPGTYTERAVYVVSGQVKVAGRMVREAEMAVLRPGRPARLETRHPARVMLIGGEPLAEPRHIWWNLVSSRPALIARAKADWKAGRFNTVPGDDEFIPLPKG